MKNYQLLSDIQKKALEDEGLTARDAASVLQWPDEDYLDIVEAARAVREKFFGKRVKLNYLVNVRSGLCPEDCSYCSQSKVSKAPIEKYPLMAKDELIAHVERGVKLGATRACLVASGRTPSERDLEAFCQSVKDLKGNYPGLEVCACLGLLEKDQAGRLKESGVTAYNHNLNTSQRHYEKVCGTHTYQDRVETVENSQSCGLSSCSGILAGMGETDEDLVETAFSLRKLQVDSIPVNFLISIPKTPLEGKNNLTPQRCLKILALFRLTNPAAEIRIAGGREVHLRSLQPLGLMIANSIFLGDYLTTKGQSPTLDLEMIRDLGYTVQGQPDDFLSKILREPSSSAALVTAA